MPFLRRISEVWIFEKDKIRVYDSVQKYLERSEDFHTLSIEESRANPFNNNVTIYLLVRDA